MKSTMSSRATTPPAPAGHNGPPAENISDHFVVLRDWVLHHPEMRAMLAGDRLLLLIILHYMETTGRPAFLAVRYAADLLGERHETTRVRFNRIQTVPAVQAVLGSGTRPTQWTIELSKSEMEAAISSYVAGVKSRGGTVSIPENRDANSVPENRDANGSVPENRDAQRTRKPRQTLSLYKRGEKGTHAPLPSPHPSSTKSPTRASPSPTKGRSARKETAAPVGPHFNGRGFVISKDFVLEQRHVDEFCKLFPEADLKTDLPYLAGVFLRGKGRLTFPDCPEAWFRKKLKEDADKVRRVRKSAPKGKSKRRELDAL